MWATKSRAKLLNKEIRPLVFEHIHQNALKKEIFTDCVNGAAVGNIEKALPLFFDLISKEFNFILCEIDLTSFIERFSY